MSRWIETKDGYVNLDHAAVIVPMSRGDKTFFARLTMVNGDTVTTEERPTELDYERLLSPVLPASSGQEAVIVHWDEEERPTDTTSRRVPVLGWRLSPDGTEDPTPILPEACWTPARTVLLALPDGGFYGAGWGFYDSLEAAEANILRLVQLRWDHAPKEAAE